MGYIHCLLNAWFSLCLYNPPHPYICRVHIASEQRSVMLVGISHSPCEISLMCLLVVKCLLPTVVPN